jgi:hypothetical protein
MPFSSITDSSRLQAVQNAYERAWAAIQARGLVMLADEEKERQRLAYIVAGLATSRPDADVCQMAVEKFIATAVAIPSRSSPEPNARE